MKLNEARSSNNQEVLKEEQRLTDKSYHKRIKTKKWHLK